MSIIKYMNEIYEFEDAGVSNCCNAGFEYGIHYGSGICGACKEHATELLICPVCDEYVDEHYDDLEKHIVEHIQSGECPDPTPEEWYIIDSTGTWAYRTKSGKEVDTGTPGNHRLAELKAKLGLGEY